MSISGSGGVLHTNSAHAKGLGLKEAEFNYRRDFKDDWNADLNAALEYAKNREVEFYHSIFPEVNDFKTFMKKIRELFQGAEEDSLCIRGLSNSNLRGYLPDFLIENNITYQIEITGDLVNNLGKYFKKLNSKNITVNNTELYAIINLNKDTVTDIKKFLNDNIGTHYVRESKNLDLLKQHLNDAYEAKKTGNEIASVLANNPNIVVIKNTPTKTSSVKMEETIKNIQELKIGERPFYLKAEDVKNGKIPEKEIEAALQGIKHYIFNEWLKVDKGHKYPGGRNILKESAEETWNEVISKDRTFFFEGLNLIKSVLGEGGEFQAKLIDCYIRKVNNLIGNKHTCEIIGGEIKDGRGQPRTDLQIIRENGGDVGDVIAGIQVKNVSDKSLQRLDINSDLDLISPNLSTETNEAIANYYFNISIKEIVGEFKEKLENYFRYYYWKAMNLHVGEGLDPNHTNTFYFAQGTSLVPASVIIESLKGGSPQEFTVDVKGVKAAKYTDDDFVNIMIDDDKDGPRPLFTDYWLKEAGKWEQTDLNKSEFSEILKSISVHTTLNLSKVMSVYLRNHKGESFEIFS